VTNSTFLCSSRRQTDTQTTLRATSVAIGCILYTTRRQCGRIIDHCLITRLFFDQPRRIIFLLRFVCLFVCRLVRQSKSQEQIFVTFLEAELKGLASRNNRIRSLSVWMLEHGYLKIASKWLQSSGNTLASTNKTRKPKSRSHRPLSQHFLFVTLNTDL